MTSAEIISTLSNACTIIATIVAAYAFFFWRKQQLYGKKIEHLLNMEDCFEILVFAYMERHAHILRQCDLANSAEGKDKEYRQLIDERIKQNFINAAWQDKLNSASFNYQLAFFRAKRMDLPVNQLGCLNPKSIEEVFIKPLENFKGKELPSATEALTNEIAEIKKSAFENFEKLRKSF
ncbi:MAG: hypothetical protein Q7U78_00850 [Gallionella sp.]|nr:hypothetical protein [Gallionella sp.]